MMMHPRSARPAVRPAALAAAFGSLLVPLANAQLQPDDVLLLRYACGGSTISVVEAYRPSTGAQVMGPKSGTPSCWEGLTFLPGGGFAVARKIPSGVNLFDENGAEIGSFHTPEVSFASDVAVFSDGSFAVVDLLGDVERYSATGQHLFTFSHPTMLSPWGVDVDDANVLWVADRVTSSFSSGALVRFDESGNWLNTFSLPVQCDDVAVAPDGTVWTVGHTDGVAYHFDASGVLLGSFPVFGAGKTAYGATVLSDGTIVFVADGVTNLARHAPDGTLLNLIPVPPGTIEFRLATVGHLLWQPVGDGLAGAAGVPELTGLGTLKAGDLTQLELANAAANAGSVLIIGAQQFDLPLLGGTLVPAPTILLQPIPTGPNGTWTLAGVWPPGVPSGTKLWFQAWVPDPGGPQGYASTAGLLATAP